MTVEQREPSEKLRKLMGQLLAGVGAEELKKMQTQFDELESRVTAEELNKMGKFLHNVVSVENLRKCLSK